METDNRQSYRIVRPINTCCCDDTRAEKSSLQSMKTVTGDELSLVEAEGFHELSAAGAQATLVASSSSESVKDVQGHWVRAEN